MNAPAQLPPIIIQRGVSWEITVALRDPDTREPVDLGGCTVYAQARQQPWRTGGLFIELAPTITDAEGGEITLAMSRTVSAECSVGEYRWDMFLRLPSDAVDMIIENSEMRVVQPATIPE